MGRFTHLDCPTRRADRKVLLWLGLIVIGLLNVGAALASNFFVLLVVRVACGLAAGLVGPSAQAAAAILSPPHERGRAMAVVLAGMTLAFTVGAPLGSIFGASFGWRATFVFSAVLAGIASILILVLLPRVEAPAEVEVRRSNTQPAGGTEHLSACRCFTSCYFFECCGSDISSRSRTSDPCSKTISWRAGLDASVGVGAMQTLMELIGKYPRHCIRGARFADRTDWARPMTWLFTDVRAVSLAVYSVRWGYSTGGLVDPSSSSGLRTLARIRRGRALRPYADHPRTHRTRRA